MNDMVLYQPKPSWNKGKLEEIWSIRTRLDISHNLRELTMFNRALDSKLRACDFIKLKVRDIAHGTTVQSRAILIKQKTGRPVQFEITPKTKDAITAWIKFNALKNDDYLSKSRVKTNDHLTTQQSARIVKRWVISIDLDPTAYGTHSMRRAKASLIYKRTKNLRAVVLTAVTDIFGFIAFLGLGSVLLL